LGSIKVPTLVAVGKDDRLTPVAEANAIHEAIAGSTSHLFPDCGHLPALEMPAEVSALLRRFLTL
jgi:pimeloyl-ACP methyl ester carboxylesterase